MPESSDRTSSPDDPLLASVASGEESLPGNRCLELYRHMVRARALEERTIQMSKSGMGFFWVGGPGEEAFGVPLGMQVNKGTGPAFDYLHLHYRNAAVLVPMGLDLIEGIRQMLMRATDLNSMGRNFVSHYARHHANILPVSSIVEVQYTMASGTALMQRRQGGNGISIVLGGEAGTAEGDFYSGLNWSTRPGFEVPVLFIVMNNGWGISTPTEPYLDQRSLLDRAAAFGMQGEVVDGNDPIASWYAIERGMRVCREERRPYLLEARVSRLYGHSSSSGAMRDKSAPDCIQQFSEHLLQAGLLDTETLQQLNTETEAELDEAVAQALQEPEPTKADLYKHTYAPSPVDVVYPDDFHGLPE